MGLGVWFSDDLAHILRGVGEGVKLLIAQRGLRDAADVAYMAGYYAALRAVATSLGLPGSVGDTWPVLDAGRSYEAIVEGEPPDREQLLIP